MSIRRGTLVLPSSHFLFSQNERIIIIKMSHSKSPQDKQEQEEDSPRANWLGVTIGVTSLYRQKSWFWFSSQTSTTCREMGTGPLVRVFSLYSSNNKQIQLVLHDNNNAQCICESSWWNIFSIFLKLGVGDTLKLTHQRPDSTSVISVRWFPPPPPPLHPCTPTACQ